MDRQIKSLASSSAIVGVEPIKLSIVVPAYNEGQNVAVVVEQAIQTLAENDWVESYELILVDDGSTDDTGQIARNMGQEYECVRVIHHPTNQGFGAALKTGYDNARGEYVTLIAGDGEIGMDQALNLFREIGEADLMVSKRLRSVPAYREVLSWGVRLLMRFIVGFDASEADGIHVIRRDVLQELNLRSKTGLLNLEILMQCFARGCVIKSGFMQASPRLSGKSKVTNLPTILKTLWEMIKLRVALLKEGYG
jgi:glycosyltransferase involved in cell wall biosynthesis